MTSTAQLFLDESRQRLALAWGRVEHCLDQLDDAHMWWSPGPRHNPIGTLILHLCGNLRQWVIAGVGSSPDTRVRHEEFIPQPQLTKAELHGRISGIIHEIDALLAALPPECLAEPRRIQGNDTTVLGAIFKAITHMEIHAGQMLTLTRMQRGDAYRESWAPRTREEGAPE